MTTSESAPPRSFRAVDSRSPAVTRAVAILEELSRRQRPMALAELSRALDLAKSTVANLCSALENTHMIRRVDGRWTLGYKLVELGRGFLAGTDIVAEFRGQSASLAVAATETLLLAVLDGSEVVYIARHDGCQPIRLASDIGLRLPAVATALGKAMLAGLPESELDNRLAQMSELPQLTARSHRTMDALRRDLDATRERGYAVDDEQSTEGVTSISVALSGSDNPPTAVGATLLAARLTTPLRESLVTDLRQLAGRLGQLARS